MALCTDEEAGPSLFTRPILHLFVQNTFMHYSHSDVCAIAVDAAPTYLQAPHLGLMQKSDLISRVQTDIISRRTERKESQSCQSIHRACVLHTMHRMVNTKYSYTHV